MNRRFGQLAYTSFDARDGNPGGWQVKETVGELSHHEVQYLSSRVATQLDTGTELPRFPTPEQIARLPRRLRHAAATELGGRATATWHTAPAGFDASGRPGNVFAHVVLDRDPLTAPGVRPILSWRSPDWLTPYGVEQVLAARLPPGVPGPGYLDATAVADLIFAPRSGHLAVLQLLLDATLATRDGGPPVVIGVPDPDAGAAWIAAVHLLMSPGTAAQHWFSTLERADALTDARALGLQLMAVPVGDLDALDKATNLVVLDADEPVDLGDLDGGPHRTQRGDEVPVTPWSVLAAEVLEDADAFVRVSAAIDRVAAEMGDADLHPAWPLAKLVADGWDVDVLAEAHRVLERHSPSGFVDGSDLRSRTGQELRRRTGGDLDRAWTAAAGDSATALDAEVYTELALADDQLLAAAGPTAVPPHRGQRAGQEVVAAVLDAAERLERWDADPITLARAGLHLLDLALGAAAGWDEQANPVLARVGHERVLAVLRSDRAHEVMASVDYQISDPARQWLWALLTHTELAGAPGERLDHDVLDWVAPRVELGEPDPLPTIGPFAGGPPPSDLAIELAWARVRSHTATAPTQAWAVVTALEHGESAAAVEVIRQVLPGWPAGWAEQLARRYPTVPAEVYAGPGLALDDQSLWHVLAERPDGALARARLRLAHVDWLTAGSPEQIATMVRRVFAAAREVTPAVPIRADLGRAIALLILAQHPIEQGWLSTIGPVTVTEGDALVRWADRLADATVVWWLLHGSTDLDLPGAGPETRWLAEVRVEGQRAADGSGPVGLVDAILIARWRRHPEPHPGSFLDQLRAEIEQAGARIDRRTDRWLRGWAQHHLRKEGTDAHVRT